MGSTTGKERCGRCSFSTIVDVVESAKSADDPDGETVSEGDDRRAGDASPVEEVTGVRSRRHDPFAGGHIEVDERDLRLANAPSVTAGRIRRWLDDTAERVIHGR